MPLEQVVRPFVGQDVSPTREYAPNSNSAPMVRIAVGQIGGTKTFSFSGSSTTSSYMAAVHTEKSSSAFNMATGELSQ